MSGRCNVQKLREAIGHVLDPRSGKVCAFNEFCREVSPNIIKDVKEKNLATSRVIGPRAMSIARQELQALTTQQRHAYQQRVDVKNNALPNVKKEQLQKHRDELRRQIQLQQQREEVMDLRNRLSNVEITEEDLVRLALFFDDSKRTWSHDKRNEQECAPPLKSRRSGRFKAQGRVVRA